MKIRILMITHNRPEYTLLSLKRLCAVTPENSGVVVWDNGSSEETINVIKKFESNPKVERIVYNESNEKLWKPTNWFWEDSIDYDFLSKVDDDCLLPTNCYEILEKAHVDIPEFGIIGCWRFLKEDFNENVAKKKIFTNGKHKIMRNCFVEGSGYLMKAKIIKEIGVLKFGESFTDYCIRAAKRGYINGWYYPFLYQEHMDDPRSFNSGIKNDNDFKRLMPLSARNYKIQNKEEWINRLKKSAFDLQAYSYDPNDYVGIRAQLKNSEGIRCYRETYIGSCFLYLAKTFHQLDLQVLSPFYLRFFL